MPFTYSDVRITIPMTWVEAELFCTRRVYMESNMFCGMLVYSHSVVAGGIQYHWCLATGRHKIDSKIPELNGLFWVLVAIDFK